MREKSKKRNIILSIVIILLLVTIGYATLSTNLTINGSSKLLNSTWNVHFENLHVTDGSVEVDENDNTLHAASIDTNDNTKVSFAIELDKPGSFYEFTVDVKNDGSIDAMIDSFDTTIKINGIDKTNDLPNWLSYSITYYDGIPIQQHHLLESGKSEKYKVRLDFNKDISNSDFEIAKTSTIELDFNVDYTQATNSASKVVPDPVSFETDSWETITRAVHSGNTSQYNVGDTKSIDMGTYGTHSLRIANMSTPEECSTEDFSQTACGFVLEFADIITKYNMNPSNDRYQYGFNIGGWKDSEARAIINNDSEMSIYNSLPQVLKNSIIDTKVVSGYGCISGWSNSNKKCSNPDNNGINFITIDKLYLLSTIEVWGYCWSDTVDENYTRHLDYYEINNITNSNYDGAKKRYDSIYSTWWLRSPISVDDYRFIASAGSINNNTANRIFGISPAFRLG